MTYTLESLKQLSGPPLSVAVAELVWEAKCGRPDIDDGYCTLASRDWEWAWKDKRNPNLTLIQNAPKPHSDTAAALAALGKVNASRATIEIMHDDGVVVSVRIFGANKTFRNYQADSIGAAPGHEFATAVSRAACVVAWMKREETTNA